MMKKKGFTILTVIIIWHIISKGWLVWMQKKESPMIQRLKVVMVLQFATAVSMIWISTSREWKEGDRCENWRVERMLWWVRWRCDISDYESLSLGFRVWKSNTNEAKSRGFFSEILWKEEHIHGQIHIIWIKIPCVVWINLWLNVIITIQWFYVNFV